MSNGFDFSQGEVSHMDMGCMGGSGGLAAILGGDIVDFALQGRKSGLDEDATATAVATANLIGLSQLDGMGIGFPLHGDTFPDHLQANVPMMPSAQLHPLLHCGPDSQPPPPPPSLQKGLDVAASISSSSIIPSSSSYYPSSSSYATSQRLSGAFSQPPPPYCSPAITSTNSALRHTVVVSSSSGSGGGSAVPSSRSSPPSTANVLLADLSPSSDSGFPSPLSLYSPSSCESTPPTRTMNGLLGMDNVTPSALNSMEYGHQCTWSLLFPRTPLLFSLLHVDVSSLFYEILD
ncbi:uncharacterized protein [Hetaerina americana]|uniref:uncharacterized protein n=1 Tax=Hetaerina americana TaxID=62018 RepID=UPI003A7F1861